MAESDLSIRALVATAASAFGSEYRPYPDVAIPVARSGTDVHHHNVAAVWTRDGLRPRWTNLAAVADEARSDDDLRFWRAIASNLNVPLVMLTTRSGIKLLRNSLGSGDEIITTDLENLHAQLAHDRRDLFSPRILAKFRSGQLSFADLEEDLTEASFAFSFRQREALDVALTKALRGSLEAQLQSKSSANVSRSFDLRQRLIEINSVVTVSIAYLSARILEDKGFFDNQRLRLDDPEELLRATIAKTNGFFERAYREHLPRVDTSALQQMASCIGNSVTFALLDHRDVGHLYEQAIKVLHPDSLTELILQTHPQSVAAELRSQLQETEFEDLEQHYTPLAIADQILDHLPLERLRPEDRVIYDPAAGSGSFLLAATRRLALMPDIATPLTRNEYLARNVLGNDRDKTARLITKLRYSLVQQTFGEHAIFPEPDHFGQSDYRSPSAWEHSVRPRVVVANPPYSEDGSKQRAAEFVEIVLSRLQRGDQFAFVLPQTVLTGRTHGWAAVRDLLIKECRILECWQLPEGVVGLSARQPVCVLLGSVGSPSQSYAAVGRAILSGANKDVIREKGFLGQAWIAPVDPTVLDWDGLQAPPFDLTVATVLLSEIFDVEIGVTPLPGVAPVATPPGDVPVKINWRSSFAKEKTLWANPAYVNPEQKYVLYSVEFLKRLPAGAESIFDGAKIIVSRSTNRNANDPLRARIDFGGMCPNNDSYCIVPRSPLAERGGSSWALVSSRDRLLWLVGILNSSLAAELSTRTRNARHLRKDDLRHFPLPAKLDRRIIRTVKAILGIERTLDARVPLGIGTLVGSAREELWLELNRLVEESYGQPHRRAIQRTGRLEDLPTWLGEKKEHSVLATGLIDGVDPASNRVCLHIDGLPGEYAQVTVELPQNAPGWALDGTVFTAEVSASVQTADELADRRWALRHFRLSPRAYMNAQELYRQFAAVLNIE